MLDLLRHWVVFLFQKKLYTVAHMKKKLQPRLKPLSHIIFLITSILVTKERMHSRQHVITITHHQALVVTKVRGCWGALISPLLNEKTISLVGAVKYLKTPRLRSCVADVKSNYLGVISWKFYDMNITSRGELAECVFHLLMSCLFREQWCISRGTAVMSSENTVWWWMAELGNG